jgi:hypothetical protein
MLPAKFFFFQRTVKRMGGLFIRGLILSALWVGAILLGYGTSHAQNFEVQVYESETVPAGKTMVETHTNMALRGTTETIDGVLPTEHALHETIEITQGITDWFEVGFYTFLSIQPGFDWEWVGNHIRPRVRVPESWDWPVGLSLSLEFGYMQRTFSTDTWTLEIRPIIDKKIERWYLAFNPSLGLSFQGENANRGLEFNPSLKVTYDMTRYIAGGIEYYTSLGPLGGFDSYSQQQHMILPVVDLDLGPEWEFNFGVGFGLTESTDRLIVKLILGRRF